MDESLRGPIIVLEVTALGVILALVDNTPIRVALGLLIAIMLARSALVAGKRRHDQVPASTYERRQDHLFRHWVDVLLKRIREFHTICHSMHEDKANLTIAQMKLREIEADLQNLLSQVADSAKPTELRRQGRRFGTSSTPSKKDEAYGEAPRDGFEYD